MPKSKPTKKRATTTKAKPKRKSASKEMLLVGSKVKLAIKNSGMNTAGDALDGLNEIVHWYISQASTRANSNGRKTVRSHDFMA